MNVSDPNYIVVVENSKEEVCLKKRKKKAKKTKNPAQSAPGAISRPRTRAAVARLAVQRASEASPSKKAKRPKPLVEAEEQLE